MNRVLPLVVTLLLVAVVGFFAWSGFKAPPVAEPAAIITTPPGWVKLDGPGFTVYAPEGAVLRQAKGNGFIYGDIAGSYLCIRFQAGKTVGPVVNAKTHPNFSDSDLEVDGRSASLRKTTLAKNEQDYWFPGCGASLYLGLTVPKALPGGDTLSLDVSVENRDGLDDAMMMFKTIRFAKGG
jgi:hypothetical protein